MLFQRVISKMSREDQAAEEKRSGFRVIRPQTPVKEEEMPQAEEEPVVLSDAEIAYRWLANVLRTRHASCMSEKCIFGTISFEVPVSECKPELVEEIMAANKVPLVKKTPWYNLKTKELRSVHFTYDTPIEGIIHMPLY